MEYEGNVIVGGDMNGHVGQESTAVEHVIGAFNVVNLNSERE